MSCSRRCGAFRRIRACLAVGRGFCNAGQALRRPGSVPTMCTLAVRSGRRRACPGRGEAVPLIGIPPYNLRPMTSPATSTRPRILTGDTPTGKLHLGHYVGSIENRLALQDQYDCYFLIANKHAFTTRADRPAEIRQSVIDIATDWLAVGIDPNRS